MSSALQLTRELKASGYTARDLRRSPDFRRVRHGVYMPVPAVEPTPRERHRCLIEATVALCSPDAVVSGFSAACLHDLPVESTALDQVELTRNRSGGSRTRRFVTIRGVPLARDDIVSIDGIAVTSLARTVIDIACRAALDFAVAVGDAALRRGLDPADLVAILTRSTRRHGIGGARRAAGLLDGRSETVGESRSRVMFHLQRLPPPVPQYTVRADDGTFVARVDFGWPDHRTVGEFDGQVKYQRALRPGHDPERELFREKRREDAIRELGLQVVRWTTADLTAPDRLAARIRRALARGRNES